MNAKTQLVTVTAGTRLRDIRVKRGLSQKQFGDKIGVSRSAVAQWETDRSAMSAENRKAAAAVLRCSGVYLLGPAAGETTAPGPAEAAKRKDASTPQKAKPGKADLSGDESDLVRHFRLGSRSDRNILLQMAAKIASFATTHKQNVAH